MVRDGGIQVSGRNGDGGSQVSEERGTEDRRCPGRGTEDRRCLREGAGG